MRTNGPATAYATSISLHPHYPLLVLPVLLAKGRPVRLEQRPLIDTGSVPMDHRGRKEHSIRKSCRTVPRAE